MQKISKKSKDALYSTVYEEIMQARVKIARLLNNEPLGREVDNVLSDLIMKAPQSAIELFK